MSVYGTISSWFSFFLNWFSKEFISDSFWVVGWMRMIHFSGFKLRMHIATFHLNMKPFRCTLCNSSFPKSSNLCYHIGTRYYSLSNYFLLLCVSHPADNFSTVSYLQFQVFFLQSNLYCDAHLSKRSSDFITQWLQTKWNTILDSIFWHSS